MSKNGLILLTPTTVDKTGGSSTATISANGSVEFSACTSLSLNGVFSADYDNYMVVVRGTVTSGAGGQTWRYRLRASGADNSTASSYVQQYLYASSTSVLGNRYTDNFSRIMGVYDANQVGFVCNFYGPYLAQPTAARPIAVNSQSGAGMYEFASTHNQSTSYDGLTFFTDAASLNGRVAVYGMRK